MSKDFLINHDITTYSDWPCITSVSAVTHTELIKLIERLPKLNGSSRAPLIHHFIDWLILESGATVSSLKMLMQWGHTRLSHSFCTFKIEMECIANAKSLPRHCILYDLFGWTSLAVCIQHHIYIFIYKVMLSKFPEYLGPLLFSGIYNLRTSK